MFASGTAAAAAVAGTGGSGLWLFSYNKENFGYDAGQRFGKFMMARGNANAQVGQYREDIEGIVGATVSKMDAWQTVTTLFLAVGAALSCAGRVGMHGCAPPGWFCALFSGSIFMSVMFNGCSLWFAMHASLRAQCASVSLLTRKVRLPIPSMGQLDQARVFGSTFEKQQARDIFRVPFMGHPHAAPEMPGDSVPKKGKTANDPQKEFGSTARNTVPSWIRDEIVVDKGAGDIGDSNGPVHEELEAPEHFKLLMKAQEEWRDYDVYARINMLFGVISFMYAVTYYAMGTAIAELRGFWVMWSLPLVFMAAQALILRLDILHTGQHRLPKAEWWGHAAPFFAAASCTCEYRYFYSESGVTLAWGFALLALGGHFAMSLRMLDIAWPASAAVEMPEEPGKQWWPASWRVPRAFTKHLWFITPPAKLDPSVSPCLMHEMEDMQEHGGGIEYRRGRAKKGAAAASSPTAGDAYAASSSPFGDFGKKRSSDLPWQLTRVVILTACLQWFFVIITTGAEIILGPESLLKPPGEPPWIRDTKYRHFTPSIVHLSTSGGLPEDYRLFSASRATYTADAAGAHSGGHEDGHHRRLASSGGDTAVDELLRLLPELADLASTSHADPATSAAAAPVELSAPPAAAFMAPDAKVHQVSWPALFQPRHLLCRPGAEAGTTAVTALSPRGVGALLQLGDEAGPRAEPFSLEGLAEFGAIAGSLLTARGLNLITNTGKHVECPGAGPVGGAWACRGAELPPLPLARGAELAAAALAEAVEGSKSGELLAVLLKKMPKVVSLFRHAGGVWHPAGEVHVPPSFGARPVLALEGEELLLAGPSGEVHRRHIRTGVVTAHPAPTSAVTREFRGVCTSGKDSLLRLALKKEAASWTPELIAAV